MRWGDYPGLPEWVLNIKTSVSIKREDGGDFTHRREAEAAGVRPKPRSAGSQQMLEEARGSSSPGTSTEGRILLTPSLLPRNAEFRLLVFRMTANTFLLFKSLNVWQFTTAAIRN